MDGMSSPPTAPDFPPPALPDQQTLRFQFHLKHLLAFMLASAFMAAGLRLLLQFLDRLPDGYLASWLNVVTCSLALGAAAYFLLRGPFLVWHAARLARRWQAVQTHRRQLAQWAKTRRGEGQRIIDEK